MTSSTRTSRRSAPRGRPAAAGIGVLLALVPIGLAVVALRDLAVAQGWSSGEGWTTSAVDALDGLTPTAAVVAVGIAALVVGLALVLLALKPPRRTHLPVATDADADVWVSPAAVAALARAVADRAPGVVSAETTRVTRRQIVVEVVAEHDRTSVIEAVRRALAVSVTGLTSATVTVKATELPTGSPIGSSAGGSR